MERASPFTTRMEAERLVGSIDSPSLVLPERSIKRRKQGAKEVFKRAAFLGRDHCLSGRAWIEGNHRLGTQFGRIDYHLYKKVACSRPSVG